MSALSHRRAVVALVATGALLLAAFAVASQAEASTLYACVKKSGSAHIFTKKPKCKKGESKLTWNSEGPAGKNGANGSNGTNGTNGTSGTNGTNGTNGQDLTSHTPLPSGQSESGEFAMGAGASGDEMGEGISFSQPLATPIAEGHAIYNNAGETSTNCPGIGHAASGYLCLYTGEDESMSFVHALNFPPYEFNSTGLYGFAIYFIVLSTPNYVDGSWTVTAK
jgi:hypothetical protein